MTSPDDAVVAGFCAAWAARDVDALLGDFTDDAVYHDIPLEPAVGRDAIRAVLELRDGKIAAWRDHFDLQSFLAAPA